MRNLGGVLLLLGVAGLFYFSDRMSTAPPLPEGLTVNESLEHPAGRFEMARYACGAGAAIGLLMALFPKGR